MRRAPARPARAPVEGQGGLGPELHPRRDLAGAAAQVRPEPGADEADPRDVGQGRLHLVEGCAKIRPAARRIDVFGDGGRVAALPQNGCRRIDRLPGAGDQADGLQLVLQPHGLARPDRPPEHLDIDRRRAVAEGREVEVLEDEIGEAAIGRRVALYGADERVRCLVRAAEIGANGQPAHIQRLAVGPDASNPVHRPLAQADREGEGIGVSVGGAAGAPAAGGFAAAAALVDAALLEARRPDDLSADAGAAEGQRDRRAFRGGVQLQPRKLTPHGVGGGEGGADLFVDIAADQRADAAADRAADRRSDGGEDHLRHGTSPSRGSGRRGRAFAPTSGPSSSPRRRAPSRRGSPAAPAQRGWRGRRGSRHA